MFRHNRVVGRGAGRGERRAHRNISHRPTMMYFTLKALDYDFFFQYNKPINVIEQNNNSTTLQIV